MHSGHGFVSFWLLLLSLCSLHGTLGNQSLPLHHRLASSCIDDLDGDTPSSVFIQRLLSIDRANSTVRQADNASNILTQSTVADSKAEADSNRTGVSFSRRSDEAKDLLFIHIPKTAGSSVEDAGLKAGIQWGLNFERSWGFKDGDACQWDGSNNLRCNVEGHGNDTCTWRHVPPQYLKAAHNVYYNSDSFCIVRDPFDRFVSEYVYLVTGPYADLHADPILWEFPVCSAEGLNYVAEMVLRNVSDIRFDCHFVPQIDYVIGEDGHRWCQNVLRFEQLPGAFDEFMASRSLPIKLSETNKAESCFDLSAVNLTQESRKIISEVYHADFVSFNYTSES